MWDSNEASLLHNMLHLINTVIRQRGDSELNNTESRTISETKEALDLLSDPEALLFRLKDQSTQPSTWSLDNIATIKLHQHRQESPGTMALNIPHRRSSFLPSVSGVCCHTGC